MSDIQPTVPAAVPALDPRAQARYQVRFDWGLAGAQRVASGADATIWVDQLAGDSAAAPVEGTDFVVRGSLQNADALARWALARQEERGGRFVVAVIAAGEPAGESDASAEPRFAVEDLLAAGAVIAALTEVGLDHCSPEAAVAAAAQVGLRNAVKHLVKNSVSGLEQGVRSLDLDPVDTVEVLRAP